MALWQALPATLREKVAIVGLSGTGSWNAAIRGIDRNGAVVGPDRLDELFGPSRRVFVVLDRDDPYENPMGADSVARAWTQIHGDLGRKARRVILPQGINDVAEFFQRYDWAAFEVLLKRAAEPIRHYPRLDLSKPVPDTDWLIEGLLVAHEATGLVGDGGVGKSFITMSMALCVADPNCDEFLGLPVKKHGRVLYVDEENSADLVLQRLNALGMTPEHRKNIDYIWYAGVDLLNEPEKLHEEALDLDPVLIVLDSLSRVAVGAEENSNTDMTRLVRNGIVPLARDSGAGVVVVHHTAKDGANPRGATAIRNAADQMVSVVAAEEGGMKTGVLNVFPSKPRRQGETIRARIKGDMETDGWVRVVPADEEIDSF